jgi:hypothetical protein
MSRKRKPASPERLALAAIIRRHITEGTSPGDSRGGHAWTADDVACLLGHASDGASRTRFSRFKSAKNPSRPNSSWFMKLLDAWFGPANAPPDEAARLGRAEALAAYRAVDEPVVSDAAVLRVVKEELLEAPAGLALHFQHFNNNLPLLTDPVDESLAMFRTVAQNWRGSAVGDTRVRLERPVDPAFEHFKLVPGRDGRERMVTPGTHYHCAIIDGDSDFIVASKLDPHDTNPYIDPEGVVFRKRHIFIFRRKRGVITVGPKHYLMSGRIAHMAMRVVGGQLKFFCNVKLKPDKFVMEGRMYTIDRDLRPKAVDIIFEDQNWGWSPWIDLEGRVHHGDSATRGNRCRIGTEIADGKTWGDVTALHLEWRRSSCPYDVLDASADTGYLQYLELTDEQLKGLE